MPPRPPPPPPPPKKKKKKKIEEKKYKKKCFITSPIDCKVTLLGQGKAEHFARIEDNRWSKGITEYLARQRAREMRRQK